MEARRHVVVATRLTRSQAAGLRRLARAQVPRQTRSQFVAGLVQAELERRQVQDGIAQALAVGRTDG